MGDNEERTSAQVRAARIRTYLQNNPGARAKELASELHVGEPAVSNAVQLLKDQGIVVQYKEPGKAGYALKIKQTDDAMRRKILTKRWEKSIWND